MNADAPRLRFPLYARILAWFFLNLLLLALAVLALLRLQFHSGFDWLLAAGAGQRVQAVTDVIAAELSERRRAEWDEVLERFNQAYRLKFLLFDNADGRQIGGELTDVPAVVRVHIPGRRGSEMRPPFFGDGPPHFPREERIDRPGPMPGVRPGENPKFVVRSKNPQRYWVLVRIGLRGPAAPRPMAATLAVVSPTLSAGGLFFDYKPWVGAGLGAIALSGLLWFPFVRSLTRSIGQMTQATRAISEGRFDERVDEARRDELGLLGQSINRMAARLSGFVMGQKRFLGDIAHELCAPIARTQVALGILEQRATEKDRAYLEDLREEVQHISALVNELLSFSKASLGAKTITLKPVLLRAVVEEAVKRESSPDATVQLEIPPELGAMAEPELLVRAVANLLRNAIRYAGTAGPVAVWARQQGDEVLLTVADSGPGVPEAELARIFDPFYRLDTSRDARTGGIGLGLAIVKTCVESCRGSVSCRNRQPCGLEVTIKLPAAAAAETAEVPL